MPEAKLASHRIFRILRNGRTDGGHVVELFQAWKSRKHFTTLDTPKTFRFSSKLGITPRRCHPPADVDRGCHVAFATGKASIDDLLMAAAVALWPCSTGYRRCIGGIPWSC